MFGIGNKIILVEYFGNINVAIEWLLFLCYVCPKYLSTIGISITAHPNIANPFIVHLLILVSGHIERLEKLVNDGRDKNNVNEIIMIIKMLILKTK